MLTTKIPNTLPVIVIFWNTKLLHIPAKNNNIFNWSGIMWILKSTIEISSKIPKITITVTNLNIRSSLPRIPQHSCLTLLFLFLSLSFLILILPYLSLYFFIERLQSSLCFSFLLIPLKYFISIYIFILHFIPFFIFCQLFIYKTDEKLYTIFRRI